MIPMQFNAVAWDDIEALVTVGRPEDRALEYKQELPGNSDDDKKEFLADLSALANTAGGDLIYGIEEQRDAQGKPTGIPTSIHGITVANMDSEIRRLENLLRDSVEPRMLGIRMKPLQAQDGRIVLLVRTPASLVGPHVVRFKTHWRFYGRNSAGKYPFDLGEVRAAFAAAEDLPERLRRFRGERLVRIAGDETPVSLKAGPKLVLHLIPLAAMSRIDSPRIDFRDILIYQFTPLRSSSLWHRLNIDGGLVYTGNEPTFLGYCQLFRTGIIEVVDTGLFEPQPSTTTPLLRATLVEGILISATRNYLRRMRDELGLQPPLYVMLSLLGGRGISFYEAGFTIGDHTVDRDIVLLPEVFLESFDGEPAEWYREIFDALWQSAGFQGSQNYTTDGKRKPVV